MRSVLFWLSEESPASRRLRSTSRGGGYHGLVGLIVVIDGSAGRFHVAGADHEVAEALAGGALQGIAADDRSEEGDDVGVEDARLVEDVQTGTVESGAEVDVVFTGARPTKPISAR